MLRTDKERLAYLSMRSTEVVRTAFPGAIAAAVIVSFEHEDPALVRILWKDRPGYPKEQIKKLLKDLDELKKMLEEELNAQ